MAFYGRLLPSVVVITAVLVSAGRVDSSEADSSQPDLLTQLRESRAEYHTVGVSFVQLKTLAVLDVKLESRGMIFFRRPGSVRYEVVAPVRSLLLHDGKKQKVQYYAFSEGKWKLLRSPAGKVVGQVLRQIGNWIQGDFDADRKMFDVSVVPSEKGAGIIRLTPRSDALGEFIQKVDVHVEKAPDYRVTRVTIQESDVDVTELRFTKELRNRTIPEGTFVSPEASAECEDFFKQKEAVDPNEPEKPES